jgi:hypothetical protein
MSKELVKEALGMSKKNHEYDMRPRFRLDEYVEIMEMARDTGIPPNVVLRAMTKLYLRQAKDSSRETVLNAIKTITAAA